ncbi:MAG: 16S rRNA (cytosine(1402)-N(4))-methyltransferase RsmH [Patescibacteria group bacterium]|nr:16S rRNA (cytosine(1402)-N(4))-methyltransferase RsmH [Patescibacteria group bacterium]
MAIHKSVLLKEVLEYLNPEPNHNFIDCTFGGGGHSREILKRIAPAGKLLAIDADAETRNQKPEIRDDKNFIFVNANFRDLENIVKENFPYPVNGILMDLGLSSDQLESSGRGFTFQKDEPLDMRFDTRKETKAADILNFGSLDYLKNIFENYGEIRPAEKLARKIIDLRKQKKFQTTFDLVAAVDEAGIKSRSPKINSATLAFQALRLAVNDELGALKNVLPAALNVLAPGGRLAVISFHALEDKIVKNVFRDWYKAGAVRLLTKKPVAPSWEEVKTNNRSRSAKLRVIEKI